MNVGGTGHLINAGVSKDNINLLLTTSIIIPMILFSGTVSNIPSGMVTDQFGMVGLLTFIRAADTDPNLVALAPGIDLTTLGKDIAFRYSQKENLLYLAIC